jgi:hypothetical protein
MSIRRDALGDTPLEIAGILGGGGGGSPWTVTYWVKRVGNGGGWDVPLSVDTDSTSGYAYVSRNASGTAWDFYVEGGTEGSILDQPPTADVWYFVAAAADVDTNVVTYWKEDGDGALTDGPNITDGNDKPYTHLLITESPWGGEWFNGSIVAVKMWDVVLSKAEIETEMNESAAQKTSDLVGEWHLENTTNMLTDSSAASNDLTGGTNLSTDADTPGDLDAGGTTFQESVAGSITPTGAIAKQVETTEEGTVTATGALARKTSTTYAGSVTPTGSLLNTVKLLLTGIITTTGVVATAALKLLSLAGSVTASGALLKKAQTTEEGTVAPSGSLVKEIGKTVAGSVTPAGSLLKSAAVSFASTVTAAGTVATQALKTMVLAGSVTVSGAVSRQVAKLAAGTVTPTGVLTRKVSTTLTGTVTVAGALLNRARIAVAGSITPAGTVVAEKVTDPVVEQTGFRFRNDDGDEAGATWRAALNTDINMADADTTFRFRLLFAETGGVALGFKSWVLQRSLNSGSWAAVGDSTAVIELDLSGNVADGEATTQQLGSGTFDSGEIVEGSGLAFSDLNADEETEFEWVLKLVAADVVDTDTIDFRVVLGGGPDVTYTEIGRLTVGGVTYQQVVAGSVTPAGVLAREPQVRYAGAVAPTGVLTRKTSTTLAGSVTVSGNLWKTVKAILTGQVTPSGSVVAELIAAFQISLAGVIAPSGTVIKRVEITEAGTVTPTGAVAKTVETTHTGTVTVSGVLGTAATRFASFAGSITPTGLFAKLPKIVKGGSVTPTGGLTRTTSHTEAGTVTPTGGLVKKITTYLAGSVTPLGDLAARVPEVFFQAIAGAVTVTSTLIVRILRKRTERGNIGTTIGRTRQGLTDNPGNEGRTDLPFDSGTSDTTDDSGDTIQP